MKRLILLTVCAVAGAQTNVPTSEETGLKQLLTVRRVFSSLEESKLFIITENQEKADTILRGAAEDLVYTDTHSSSDGINARANAGSGRTASTSRGVGLGFGDNESDHSTERRHEAIAAVRLVNKDGDVIWATTQESLGAKFRGASSDVAEKITSQLKDAYVKARSMK